MTEQVGGRGGGGGDALPAHPIVDFAARLRGRLDRLRSSPVPAWSMTADDKRQALLDLAVAQAQLDAMRLELMCEAERSGDVAEPGDRGVAEWVARTTRQTRGAARADLALGLSLDEEHPAVAGAMAAGEVNLAQGRAIVRSLALLPRAGEFATTADQRRVAEEHLVELAASYDARELEVLGRRIYSVVCPEDADAYEGRLLEAEEARAARKVSLETWEDPQGLCHGRFRIPRLHGHILRKALEALTNPVRPPGPEEERAERPAVEEAGRETRPLPVRRGEALCELLERICAKDLPSAAGGGATVVVTMTMPDLLRRLDAAGVATLDTGGRISAAEARRLACRHRVLPAVLGGRSQVLDLGAAQRLFNSHQRLALGLSQGGCTAEHCGVPAAMCHAHHDHPWSQGGPTDLANGRLLCGPHHRRVHDPAFRHERLPGGRLRFHRRT